MNTKNKLGDGQLFKISRFKEMIKKTHPHKHEGYYELIFLKEGEGFHWVESQQYQVKPPEIYFLKPGQLHHWQFTAIPKGFVLLFKLDFFDTLEEANNILLLQSFEATQRIKVDNDFPAQSIFEDLLRAYSVPSPYADHIIQGYLRVLLAKILSLLPDNKLHQHYLAALPEKFMQLVAEKCNHLHQVKDYANLLDTSPQHLNAVCRKHFQMKASGVINRQLMLEAKRYILHTEHSITEIAYLLNFSDPSYFVKFFKKNEGLPPAQFRSLYMKNMVPLP